jgi:hypothetical protein
MARTFPLKQTLQLPIKGGRSSRPYAAGAPRIRPGRSGSMRLTRALSAPTCIRAVMSGNTDVLVTIAMVPAISRCGGSTSQQAW